ncbi:MAG: glycosyltransferase family 2 protein [Oscillospiraceae bacterium]|nr:glycosyltransferase family 2 protein [Oscillospiraceae bacterium]
MKISACWIVKNEEKNIARSIGSLKAVCDEMIVVDTGSMDGTVKAAEEAGARVEYFEWISDFSAAKNHALSLTSGDAIIFLDADEWFSPPLTASDKADIAQFFMKNPKAHTAQLKIHNLNAQGNVKTVTAVDRIIRKADGIAYHKPVHEILLLKNGSLPASVQTDKWPIFHSGYTEDILGEKMDRNIALLENAIQTTGSANERHMQHCYLVREYLNQNRMEDCERHLKAALSEPELLKSQIKYYLLGIVPILYGMLVASSRMRDKVSRLELYDKIVLPFKKYLAEYRGAATIGLYYDALFDQKEDVLLESLSGALEKSRRLPETPVNTYKDAEGTLYIHAAKAALRRGKHAQAMDYMIEVIQSRHDLSPPALNVLLQCVKGQSSHDIIAFLNSLFDIKSANTLNLLARATRMDGFGEVHAYYLNKKIEAGIATQSEYLSLLLLYGKDEEAVNAATDFFMEKDKGLAATYIFLAAVCFKNEDIYLKHKELLGPLSEIIDAYFGGGYPKAVTDTSVAVVAENFSSVAFIAGIERALDLLRVISSRPLIAFHIKADYCVKNGLYALPLEDILPDADDGASNYYVIECLIMLNRCSEAVYKLEHMFGLGHVTGALLRQALAVYDRIGDIRAKRLYDEYKPAYDRLVDLTDVVNTGYVPSKYAKGKNVSVPVKINGLLEIEAKAAKIINDSGEVS